MERTAALVSLSLGRTGVVALLSLAAVVGCNARAERDQPDDRSVRARLEDEFAGCPPMVGINAAAGGWELGQATRYSAVQRGDVVIVRAVGREDIAFDQILAVSQPLPPAAAAPAAGAGAAKPPPGLARPAPSTTPVVYFYRRPPSTPITRVKENFNVCGHFRSAKSIPAIILRDASGDRTLSVEKRD